MSETWRRLPAKTCFRRVYEQANSLEDSYTLRLIMEPFSDVHHHVCILT
jgi:hypothetical protein